MPHPSRCGPVAPPRRARPAKLKQMSVGTFALMPSSSHMPVFRPLPLLPPVEFIRQISVPPRRAPRTTRATQAIETIVKPRISTMAMPDGAGEARQLCGGLTSRSQLRNIGPIGSAQRTALVPAIGRAPGVFVGLLPAQKVELAAACPRSLMDGVGQKDGARALRSGTRIEAAQVSVGSPTVGKAVVHSNEAALDPEPVRYYPPPPRGTFSLLNQQLTPILSRSLVESNCRRDTSRAPGRKGVCAIFSRTLLS